MESSLPAQCVIDGSGVFKYIQILETLASDKTYKRILIRGTATCRFHRDTFEQFMNEIDSKSKYIYEPIGGGRINREVNKVFVYGYSSAYGQCDHDITCNILKGHLGNNINITFSNEGY